MTIQQQYDELPQAVKDRFEASWAAHPSVINLQIRIEDAKMKKELSTCLTTFKGFRKK